MLTAQRETGVGTSLLQRIGDARRQSDRMFGVVRPQAIYERPIPERHRILFYVGHLEAFDWNLLHELLGLKGFAPDFDRLFAFGIDPVGGGLPTDQPGDWPDVEAVQDYVRRNRALLDDALSRCRLDSDPPGRDGFPLETILNVAIEHRLMHVETLGYMLHQLPLTSKIPPQNLTPFLASSTPEHRMIRVPAGVVTMGLSRASGSFGWDNEFETHAANLPLFEIDRYMVTNRQFLEFMADDGYGDRSFWNDEDWAWKEKQGVSHPVFWCRRDDEWNYRAMFGEISLPPDWPVYVSHAEAKAYARWAGKLLPTEEQWQRAAYGENDDGSNDGRGRRYPWGSQYPDASLGNFDFESWDPEPVNAHPRGASAFGVEGMLGNGWEWTSTVFGPFPGFAPFPFYRGYSADFFDGKHFVMKGGSARTAACMLRSTFRNWFQSQYQYVYAGFRCVRV